MINIKETAEYFLDKNISAAQKVWVVIIIITTILLINDMMGFSYYHFRSNQIKATQEIGIALTDTTLTAVDRTLLKENRTEILLHEPYSKQIPQWYFTMSFSEYENGAKPTYGRTVFWNVMSSAWYFIALIAFMFAIIFIPWDDSIIRKIGVYLQLSLLFTVCGWTMAKLLSYVPLIIHPVINYTLNALLSFLIAWGTGHMIKKSGYFTRDNNEESPEPKADMSEL